MFGLIIIGLCFLFNYPLTPPANSLIQDHAIIQRRRIVIVRTAELRRQFPERRTAVVTYPVITGLAPKVLRKVRAHLAFKKIFDYSLAEYKSDAWLSEFSYVVNHNANSLLDITFTQSGMAAYPDEQSKHYLINLRTGDLVLATDAFEDRELVSLTAMVDAKLQDEIRQLQKENAGASDRDADEKSSVNDAYDLLKFERKDLDNFSVTKKGVTFLYDSGFPHVIKALEPQGRYFFSYQQLKPYIKRSGPLGQFIR